MTFLINKDIRMGIQDTVILNGFYFYEIKTSAPKWDRTTDLVINSHTLCRLSYGSIIYIISFKPFYYGPFLTHVQPVPIDEQLKALVHPPG